MCSNDYRAFHIDICEADEIVFLHITHEGFYLGDNDGRVFKINTGMRLEWAVQDDDVVTMKTMGMSPDEEYIYYLPYSDEQRVYKLDIEDGDWE